MATLEQFFVEELCAIYDGEARITQMIPKMIEAAQDEELKTAFDVHLRETAEHIKRLDQIFDNLAIDKLDIECQPIIALIEQAEALIGAIEPSDVLDAVLIVSAQKIEHYEIASYGSLKAIADCIGHTDAARVLDQTLTEEIQTDENLTKLADAINETAAEADEEVEET